MKPLHIGLLIAAGAVGGALLMRVVERPHPAPLSTIAEQTPAQVAAPASAPAPAPEPVPVEPAPATPPVVKERPSPFVPPRQAHRTQPVPERKGTWATQPDRQVAAVEQAPVSPTPAPEPIAPATAPQPEPTPPARPEPEHVTPAPAPAPPEPHKVTLNAGTLFPVRLVDGLTTERNVAGDLFTATLDNELVVDDYVLAERGARVEGRVVESDHGGRVRGVASLGVELTRLRLSDGQWIDLSTDSFVRTANPSHGEDAAKIGAGAALGAVIGAIAGGGKGAAIGAGAGGAAGAGTVLATRGRAAALPSEIRVSFRLRTPVVITERM